MKRFIVSTLLAMLMLASSPVAFGHGFRLARSGNSIVTISQDGYGVLYNDLFREQLNDYTTYYEGAHGLISRYTSGAPAPYSNFDATDSFRFDVIGPLLYSDGLTVTTAASNVTMTGLHLQPPNQSIVFSGSSNNTSAATPVNIDTPNGFQVSATNSHHVSWSLNATSGTIPEGAYGFQYRISGYDDNNPNAPFNSADVFMVYDTEGANWGTGGLGQLLDAQLLLYEAYQQQAFAPTVAPEPASWLIVLGTLLGTQACRRKKRQTN